MALLTIEYIVQLASTSRSMISRALKSCLDTLYAIHKYAQRIIEEHEYAPQAILCSLIYPWTTGRVQLSCGSAAISFPNLFFSLVAQGIDRAKLQHSSCTLFSQAMTETRLPYHPTSGSNCFDNMIMLVRKINDQFMALLRNNTPLVVGINRLYVHDLNYADVKHWMSACTMVACLLRLQDRQVKAANNHRDDDHVALLEQCVLFEAEEVIESDFTRRSVGKIIPLLPALTYPPSAVLTASDTLWAIDLSPLRAVQQQIHAMRTVKTDLLIDVLEQSEYDPVQRRLPTSLSSISRMVRPA